MHEHENEIKESKREPLPAKEAKKPRQKYKIERNQMTKFTPHDQCRVCAVIYGEWAGWRALITERHNNMSCGQCCWHNHNPNQQRRTPNNYMCWCWRGLSKKSNTHIQQKTDAAPGRKQNTNMCQFVPGCQ